MNLKEAETGSFDTLASSSCFKFFSSYSFCRELVADIALKRRPECRVLGLKVPDKGILNQCVLLAV